MRATRARVEMTAADVQETVNERLPTGYFLNDLVLAPDTATANFVTPWGAVSLKARCLRADGELCFTFDVKKWVTLPALLVRPIVERLIRGVSGLRLEGSLLFIDLPVLLAAHVVVDALSVTVGDGVLVLDGSGISLV